MTGVTGAPVSGVGGLVTDVTARPFIDATRARTLYIGIPVTSVTVDFGGHAHPPARKRLHAPVTTISRPTRRSGRRTVRRGQDGSLAAGLKAAVDGCGTHSGHTRHGRPTAMRVLGPDRLPAQQEAAS